MAGGRVDVQISATDWPGPTNTGVPAGTSLTTHVGDFHTSSAGQVVDSLLVTGIIYMDHDNTELKNTKGQSPGLSSCCVEIGYSGAVTGVRVHDCELDGGTTDQCGIRSQNNSEFLAERLNIHNCENGARLSGNGKLRSSWIHSFASHQGDSLAHYDGVEVYDGSNQEISGNNIDLDKTETSCVNIQGDFASISTVLVSGNKMRGGGWIVNIRKNPPGANPVDGVTVNNNVFGASGLGYGAVDATHVTFSGNTDLTTGANIDTQI